MFEEVVLLIVGIVFVVLAIVAFGQATKRGLRAAVATVLVFVFTIGAIVTICEAVIPASKVVPPSPTQAIAQLEKAINSRYCVNVGKYGLLPRSVVPSLDTIDQEFAQAEAALKTAKSELKDGASASKIRSEVNVGLSSAGAAAAGYSLLYCQG